MNRNKDVGVLLISFGVDYDMIAPHCAESIRKFSEIPILVHTNIPEFIRNKKWNEIHGVKFVMHEMNDSDNRLIKTQLSAYTEFNKTLYMDVDSEILSKEFLEPFSLLDKCDIVSPEWKTFTVSQIYEISKTKSKFKNFLNIFKMFKKEKETLIAGGVCYFKKSHASDLFFIEFNKIWNILGCKEDMPALNGAMFKYSSIVKKVSNLKYNNYNSTVICSQHNSLMNYEHMKNFTRRRCSEKTGEWEYCVQGSLNTFSKPKIAFIYDIVGWAFYNMAHNIKKELNEHYEVDVVAYDKLKKNNKYDAVICFSPNVIPKIDASSKIICGISSHSQKNIDKLKKYRYVFSNDIELYEQIKHNNRYYIPNGIDTEFFKLDYRMHNHVINIGAIGTTSRMEHKGYSRVKEIVRRLNMKGNKMYNNLSLFVDVNKRILSQVELLKYYSNINIFIVSSVSETGPNPLLESMSCMIPSVCNSVGLVPVVVDHGENGFIVDDYDDIDSYVEYINLLSTNNRLYKMASILSRASIIDYSWKTRVVGFKNMIDDFLSIKRSKA